MVAAVPGPGGREVVDLRDRKVVGYGEGSEYGRTSIGLATSYKGCTRLLCMN